MQSKKLVLSLATVLAIATTSLSAKSVYATVNGEEVTGEDVAVALRNPQIKFETLSENQKKIVLDQLIEKKLLIGESLKSGVEKNKEYQDALAKLKKDLSLEVWMQEEFKKVSVTDKEISDFYEKNKDKFITPEKLTARHILLKTEAEAKAVIKELDASSNKLEKFIELAKTKSTGPTAKNGGSLGEFAANQMVPEFSKAASALAKNTYTKSPVKTQFGYHVIYLEDKKASQKLNLDQVKNQIKQGLSQERFKDIIKKKVEALKKTAKIVIK